ncbi:MAG: hypothetical protein FWE55_03875 [Synergistaceae bacterium]|nr:hypothetical protein [Synergistaceae bacterium]
MNDLLEKSFDFGVRLTELAGWLKDEGKPFPLIGQLLECGAGICVSLRISNDMPLIRRESYAQAFQQSEEAEYLLEMMVKVGCLTELQSRPLLSDCRFIKEGIMTLKKERKRQGRRDPGKAL